MLSLKLWRRVRQESCKSEVPIGGGTTDVGVSIHAPRRIIIVGVNKEVPVGGAKVTILDLSVPVLKCKDPNSIRARGRMRVWWKTHQTIECRLMIKSSKSASE